MQTKKVINKIRREYSSHSSLSLFLIGPPSSDEIDILVIPSNNTPIFNHNTVKKNIDFINFLCGHTGEDNIFLTDHHRPFLDNNETNVHITFHNSVYFLYLTEPFSLIRYIDINGIPLTDERSLQTRLSHIIDENKPPKNIDICRLASKLCMYYSYYSSDSTLISDQNALQRTMYCIRFTLYHFARHVTDRDYFNPEDLGTMEFIPETLRKCLHSSEQVDEDFNIDCDNVISSYQNVVNHLLFGLKPPVLTLGAK